MSANHEYYRITQWGNTGCFMFENFAADVQDGNGAPHYMYT